MSRFVQRRVLIFQSIIVVIFLVMIAQLWNLQILQGPEGQERAQENRLDTILVNAPRGVLYDRQGRILVRNRPRFSVTVLPANVYDDLPGEWEDEVWNQVADVLVRTGTMLGYELPTQNAGQQLKATYYDEATHRFTRLSDIEALCQTGDLFGCFAAAVELQPYKEYVISDDVSQETAFVMLERELELPGIYVLSDPQRQYLYGPLYSHIIGYQSRVGQELLDSQTTLTENPYLASDQIGVTGLEASYEDELRGVRGERTVERNVLGRETRLVSEAPATPGSNLFLTIDTALQQAVQDALQEGMNAVESEQGVAIVMNPNSGEIYAMVSLPTYDVNEFVGGVDPDYYQSLLDDPTKPLFNRAISGTFPPGSIYKIIPAAGALADDVITRDTTINDPGVIILPNQNIIGNDELAMELGQPFVCWLKSGHGDENVVEALAHSCDVFFYEVAGGYLDEFSGLGVDAMAKWSKAFGLGEPTRVRLPGEVSGLVPTRDWKRQVWQERWTTGNTYNMGIGQGDLLVTPLQMASAVSAIANGGIIYEPQLVYQVQSPTGQVLQPFAPRILRHVNVPPEDLSMVAEGMLGATTWEDGTATEIFAGSPVTVAGKTGTAEYCERYEREDGEADCLTDPDGYQLTHAWFSAFAPYDNPEIAVVVFVHGNKKSVIQGSEVAAPIARKIIDYYFSERPLDPLQPAEPTPEGAIAATPTPTITAPELTGSYRAVFLSTSGRNEELSSISGTLVDSTGVPIPGVSLTIDRGGSPVATVTSDRNGEFFYGNLNASQSLSWYVRANLPGSPYIFLNVAPYSHYTVRFEEVR